MNKQYAKLTGGKIEYAPASLDVEGGGIKLNPTEESYLAHGWKKVIDEKPKPLEGFSAVVSSWKEEGDNIVAVYKMVATALLPKPPRVFSKYKLLVALKEAGKWVLVKAWLEEKAYWDLYLAAHNFSEDDPYFAEALSAIKQYTGLTDAEVEAVLSKCIYKE